MIGIKLLQSFRQKFPQGLAVFVLEPSVEDGELPSG
jgi:hypothetical protein